jgi:hypothetical protein
MLTTYTIADCPLQAADDVTEPAFAGAVEDFDGVEADFGGDADDADVVVAGGNNAGNEGAVTVIIVGVGGAGNKSRLSGDCQVGVGKVNASIKNGNFYAGAFVGGVDKFRIYPVHAPGKDLSQCIYFNIFFNSRHSLAAFEAGKILRRDLSQQCRYSLIFTCDFTTVAVDQRFIILIGTVVKRDEDLHRRS